MKIVTLFLISVSLSWGITHEVHPISQAHSLHGTDVSEEFQGEPVQAMVSSFPAVVTGALPEALIDAVAAPHKLPGPASYVVPEVNLLVLCKIKLTAETRDDVLYCTYDLSALEIPEEVDLSIRTILQLSLKSVKTTLRAYYRSAKISQKVTIRITGTTEKNDSLKDLASTSTLGK